MSIITDRPRPVIPDAVAAIRAALRLIPSPDDEMYGQPTQALRMTEPEGELPPEISAGVPNVRSLISRGDRPCSVCHSWPPRGSKMWSTNQRGTNHAVCDTCVNNLMLIGLVVLALVAPGGVS